VLPNKKGKISNKALAAIFIAIFIIAALALLLINNAASPAGQKTAHIYINGELYSEIALNGVNSPYLLALPCGNTIYVENGAVSVVETDCPDLLCVKQGSIERKGHPIVCLPNKLLISIETAGDIDGVSR
jgi:hypothetical protein